MDNSTALAVIGPRRLQQVANLTPPKYYQDSEVKHLLSTLVGHPREHLLINLLWKSGARISEALAIRKKDIDSIGNTLRIVTLKSGLKHTRYQGLGRPSKPTMVKRQVERIVIVPPDLTHELLAYANHLGPDDQIFTFTRVHAGRIVSDACIRAGLDPELAHPHTFRHSYAIHMLRGGMPVTVVKNLLGHSRIESTIVYLQITQQEARLLFNQISW
jgi:integrase